MKKEATYAEKKYIKNIMEENKFEFFKYFRDMKIDGCYTFEGYFKLSSSKNRACYQLNQYSTTDSPKPKNKDLTRIELYRSNEETISFLTVYFPEIEAKRWDTKRFYNIISNIIRKFLKQYLLLKEIAKVC